MENRDLDELGERISEIIDTAVNSQDFQKLNETILRAVGSAIDSGSDAIRTATRTVKTAADPEAYKRNRYVPPSSFQKREQKPQETRPVLYAQSTGERVKGVLSIIGGSFVTLGAGGGLLAVSLATGLHNAGSVVGAAVLAIVTFGGISLVQGGRSLLGQTTRFRQYIQALNGKTYIDYENLAKISGKSLKFVRKDVRRMLDRGWFLQGHIDSQERFLITSNETYEQYEAAEKQLELRKKEEASKPYVDAAVRDILDKGEEYLNKIHKSNDRIPGEEISAKISRMEELVRRIFERVKEHPESADDLKKLMNYYLPTTVKLLDVYEELDRQPVQGENIRKSKQEIEETMDTLSVAFEKLLDSIFQETAVDVSSDITVLNTILAQEGLTDDAIQTYSRGKR